MSTSPIIVLDSGLGGLTVVKAIREQLPHEDILYFGDTARLPYGSKTAATVTTYVEQIIAYLRPYDPKHVVIACNTATALALPAVRQAFPGLSVSGVVEPGAKAAAVAAGAKEAPVIGIIATEATVRSKAYERAIHRRRNHARLLLRPAPLLVPIIEEGRNANDPLVRLALKQYLLPMAKHRMDVLVLGCTHYPIYKDLISRMLGPTVRVIDSAEQCAQDVARRLRAAGLLRPGTARGLLEDDTEAEPGPPSPEPTAVEAIAAAVAAGGAGGAAGQAAAAAPAPSFWQGRGTLRCFVTDDAPRFARLAPRFLGVAIEPPTWVAPDELYNIPVPSPVRIPA